MGETVKLDVYKIDGTATGEQVELSDSIFAIEPNDHAIWAAVTAEMANQRQGTSATKTRTMVSGGGKKPWKQKGRGGARAGSTRSPIWVGGGRVFGPHPRQYKTEVPKKLSRLARRSALSYKAKDQAIRVVEDFTFEAPKTGRVIDVLKKFEFGGKKALFLTGATDQTLVLSCRNVPTLSVKEASSFSTRDVLSADVLIIQKAGLSKIQEVLDK
jgi:large subunit ribosomal protein L4